VRAGAVAIVLFAALAPLSAASAWPPWQTIAQHDVPQGPRQRAFVAGSLRATNLFAVFLRPEDRAALAALDYRARAVVAVFRPVPSTGYVLEIRSMRRRKSRLTIVAAIRPPTGPVSPVITTACHVVSVPRRLLGTPLPRRLVVRETRED
jgi:hypothetical protein